MRRTAKNASEFGKSKPASGGWHLTPMLFHFIEHIFALDFVLYVCLIDRITYEPINNALSEK